VIEHVEVQVLILLLIASLVGMLARRIRVPYTLALVVAGLTLSFLHLEALADLQLTPELLLLLFLPPLLFEAAYHLPFDDLRHNAVHVALLALVGVIASMLLTAVVSYGGIRLTGILPSFAWSHAFLFGAVIVATDPISVLALFKELGAPKRLYQLVEGESLINDGVAVVLFAIIGGVFGIQGLHGAGMVELEGARDIVAFAVISFVKVGVGGVLAGVAAGALASVITRHVDDHLIEITLTTLVAWGSFLVAEQLHVSGVLSTVAAGITMGSFGKHYGMSASTRIAVQDFWEYMGFVANSFIFLLIGLELEPWVLVGHLLAIAVAFVAVVLARAAVIYSAVPLADRLATPVPSSWRHVLVWGGLRGSLSMVLVLGLPTDFAGRSMLVQLVFGVVAVSLFLQGLTMAPLMRRLGLMHGGGLATSQAYENARGRAVTFRRVLNEAQRLFEQDLLDEPTHRRLAHFYEREREQSRTTARQLAGESAEPEQLLDGAKTLAIIEREAIQEAVRAGVLSDGSAADLVRDLDVRIERLDRAAHEEEGALLQTFDELYGNPAKDDEPAERP
jgi:CPA1 family monovalent cation:H+ antiporter